MKRLIKRAPTKGYQSDYEPSIGLIEQIAKDTREPYNTDHPGLSANDVLLRLHAGETVKGMNPFGTEVLWTLEETDADVINPVDVLSYIDEFKGQEDLLTVGEFCEHMAQAIAEGKTLSSTAEAFPHFVDWVKERAEPVR